MVLAGLVVAKLALHLLTATGYGLHRDEFLYLEMSHHLAWGYKEVPPALAPLAALSRWFGESPAFVRLWPALFGAATVGLVGWLVRELRGGWWATLAAGLATAIAPVYLVMHHLFQPSFLEVFWWTLYGCLLVRFRHGPSTHLLVAFGVAVGLGMLAKYGTVFYVLALVPAALLDSVLRPWLWSRGVDEGDEAAEVPDVNAWFRQAEVGAGFRTLTPAAATRGCGCFAGRSRGWVGLSAVGWPKRGPVSMDNFLRADGQ